MTMTESVLPQSVERAVNGRLVLMLSQMRKETFHLQLIYLDPAEPVGVCSNESVHVR